MSNLLFVLWCEANILYTFFFSWSKSRAESNKQGKVLYSDLFLRVIFLYFHGNKFNSGQPFMNVYVFIVFRLVLIILVWRHHNLHAKKHNYAEYGLTCSLYMGGIITGLSADYKSRDRDFDPTIVILTVSRIITDVPCIGVMNMYKRWFSNWGFSVFYAILSHHIPQNIQYPVYFWMNYPRITRGSW